MDLIYKQLKLHFKTKLNGIEPNENKSMIAFISQYLRHLSQLNFISII